MVEPHWDQRFCPKLSQYIYIYIYITTHLWYGDHFISINASEVWGVRVRVQVFRREIHTHIHLDYAKIEILSCIKKIKK